MSEATLESAYKLLNSSILHYRGKPVGTVAARDTEVEAANYDECFIRDFVPSALVFLMQGDTEIVRHFLCVVQQLQGLQQEVEGHSHASGLMPASFKVVHGEKDEDDELVADFGDRAIGRVAPVDSAMWWLILLRSYSIVTGDLSLAHSEPFQKTIRHILQLYMHETFETSPAMLVPDGAFMIDRRMGVYGHPLEIQALFYGMLKAARHLLLSNKENKETLDFTKKRLQMLRSYVRIFYWLDIERLNEIHRYKSEEFGLDVNNVLNIYPESIPDWLDGWLSNDSGYLVGNLGAGRIDFRLFSQGNFLAVLFGLVTEDQSQKIMTLFEEKWDLMMGKMPVKICYPAVKDDEWAYMTGSDPKNSPWSYHNGGHWPVLLWPFTGAAIRAGKVEMAQAALNLAITRMKKDNWPEYYDGETGTLIGRRANYGQVWSATAVIISHQLLESPDSLAVFESLVL